MGRIPFGVTGYGVCGYIGQRNLSITHKESKSSFSALCDLYYFISETFHMEICYPSRNFCGQDRPANRWLLWEMLVAKRRIESDGDILIRLDKSLASVSLSE
jgi:hypothetical protein